MATQRVRVMHDRVPGRVRYGIAPLAHNAVFGALLERALTAEPFVKSARVNLRTATVLVAFAPIEARARLDALLESLARAQGHAATGQTNFRILSFALFPGLRGERRAHEGDHETGASKLPWHTLEVAQVTHALGLEGVAGLPEELAAARLAEHGPNALPPPERRGELRILLEQFVSTPVGMLAASAVLSLGVGGLGDAVAILAVLAINAGIGYATESGAERTIAALTHVPQPEVPVRREGRERLVDVEQVTRGDLLVLRAGIFVAADARVIVSEDLTVDESSLTGESVPVQKSIEPVSDGHKPLSERFGMVYRGTLVTGGSGLACVVELGKNTELGHIQALASAVVARKTPMQQQLDQLGRALAAGAGLACAATMAIGLLRGQALLPMLRTAISLGVAAVPEGLPTVAMTTLALGLTRMRKERVIIRQLAAVETLGAVQAVCLDKTGTLTVNRMTVVAVQAGLQRYDVMAGAFVDEHTQRSAKSSADLDWLLRISVLCSEVQVEEQDGERVAKGAPTECALVHMALDAGLDVRAVRARYPLLAIQRRAQTRSYMSTLHESLGGRLLAVKGRPSEVLALCSRYLQAGTVLPLGEAERAHIETENERMAGRALRVLGLAYLEHAARHDAAADLVWVGLVAMQDPPRHGLSDVVARFHRAGVRTVMITGDQSATARAVARQIGIAHNGHIELVDSTRLDRIDPAVLRTLAQHADVFCRVSPAHKLQIVKALQSAGMVVAMTGDGVNDGPALKAADIGIAMGTAGSSAAREIADVVLENDELFTLITAIEQGRTIYDDIRKALHFILATNLSEVLYTFTCVTCGIGEPITPMQLLWINLLTDVFPELALAVQPPEADVLTRPPRPANLPMFGRNDLLRVGMEGTVITSFALVSHFSTLARGGSGARAATVGFTALTFAQLLHAISARSETHTIFDAEHQARNRWLPVALGGTVLLQLLAAFAPGLRRILGTVPISFSDWGTALASATAPFLLNESLKLALRPAKALLTGSALASNADVATAE